jgi:hypothetical protein
MADTPETHVTRDLGSGVAGEPGIAYDTERLGEPGDPGVPTGDQHPTEERDNIQEGGGSVGIDIPGTHAPGESRSSEPEPTKDTRETGSLGTLTEDVSTSEMAATRNMGNSDDPYSQEDAGQHGAKKHSAEQGEAK